MNWRYSDRYDSFFFTRVDRQDLENKDRVENILDGGSVSRNSLSALKTSASLPYLGALDIGQDFLRVYSVSRADHDTETVAHGTFVVSTPETVYTDAMTTGEAKLYSLLNLLQRRYLGEPLTVPEGTNAVALAVSMVEEAGLRAVSDPSAAVLNIPKTLDGALTCLEAVNGLLEFAGFRSLGVDAMGTAQMRVYRDPSELSPSIVFRSGKGSSFAPSVTHTLDTFDVPNRLTVVCSRPDLDPMYATAENNDPANRYSIPNAGIVEAEPEEVGDIASQEALQALAEQKLQAKTSAVESIQVTHTFEPFEMDDACLLDYGGLAFTGAVVSAETDLTPGMVTNTRIRRFVRF